MKFIKMKNIKMILILAVLVSAIFGCSGYGGGHQVVGKSKHIDASNYASIRCVKGLSIRYNPKEVHNRKMASIKNIIKPGLYRSLSLPPGEHTLILVYKDKNRKFSKRVNVVLKANAKYKVKYASSPFSVTFWISNEANGKLIYDSQKL